MVGEDEEIMAQKPVLVGTFNEEDLKKGRDKAAVQEAKEKYGLKYTNTEYVKKKGQIVGIKIWVCDFDQMELGLNKI